MHRGLIKMTFCLNNWWRNILRTGVWWPTYSTPRVVRSPWSNVLTGNVRNATGRGGWEKTEARETLPQLHHLLKIPLRLLDLHSRK